MRFLCFLLGFIFASPSFSAYLNENTWQSERELFRQALDAPYKTRAEAISQTLPKLKQYPLRPYLEFELQRLQLNRWSGKSVAAFQKRYAATPLDRRLQAEWLDYLYRNKRWQQYRDEFSRLPLANSHYQCLLQQANLQLKHNKEAFAAARELWLVGKSQPKSCDSLFKAWRKAGKLSSDLAYQRFWLAIDNRQYALARYLGRYISDKQQKQQFDRFWEIRNHPKRLFRGVKASDDPRTLTQGLKRAIRKEPERTVEYWLKVRKSHRMSTAQRDEIDRALALHLATGDHQRREALIAQLDPDYRLAEVTAWRARLALQSQDWGLVAELIERLPDSDRQQDIWRYWLAVALKRSHAAPETHDRANRLLLELAGERRYYGYLAATLTHQPFLLNDDPAKLDDASRQALEKLPAIQRVFELTQLERNAEAGSEWRATLRTLDDQQQKHAALLASRWGWHFTAISSAIQAGAWDLIEARFPQPHADQFARLSGLRKIDRNWSIAIARQESAFKPNARSHAGARGLMQLMPKTAQMTARKNKVPYRSRNQLYRPELNISLGTAYLAEMLDRFDGNIVHATAAYNAGPHRVDRWLKERGKLPLDVWIESIPFRETRNYVKNVLTYRTIYQQLSGANTQMLNERELALLSVPQLDKAQALLLAEQLTKRNHPTETDEDDVQLD
ncbi:transglycosylase SLT domain-containing protein [Marinobacterium arenosum]|uniref:transglycosylase SLT domain-containing protein n=1 Tax=Marinobacterium arenosum TaxID=2862496 RepID=UPI001C95C403|nr:transglycosylase SLT domain-containing protein [Marinobacterium arenosum]MBY4676924.1 transglycosylase SLT domain-containing protein [Marinobacterium arenosum]